MVSGFGGDCEKKRAYVVGLIDVLKQVGHMSKLGNCCGPEIIYQS